MLLIGLLLIHFVLYSLFNKSINSGVGYVSSLSSIMEFNNRCGNSNSRGFMTLKWQSKKAKELSCS